MIQDVLELFDSNGAQEEQSRQFLKKSIKDMKWVEDRFIDFIGFQKEGTKRRNTELTINN